MTHPDESSENIQPEIVPEAAVEETAQEVGAIQADVGARIEQIKETDRQKLERLRNEGVLAPQNCDPNFLFQLGEYGFPLRKTDLGNEPVVVTRDELERIGRFDVVLKNGEQITIDPETMSDEMLILFPDDLGE